MKNLNVPVSYELPGGRIDVSLKDGELYIHGIASLNPHTHMDRLIIMPQSANDITVKLEKRT